MPLLKTIAYSLVIGSTLVFTACKSDFEKDRDEQVYVKSEIPMSGAQSVPANNSTGLGSLAVNYSKETRLLTYTFSWSGLKDTITGIAIHGIAPPGFPAAVKQSLPGVSTDPKANQRTYPYQAGSYSGTLWADGVNIKENDIINQLYYVSIRTKAFPGGEIRAQIKFQ